MRRRGLSLLELLMSMLIIGLAMGAVTRAYVAGIEFEDRYGKAVERQRVREQFEDELTTLLRGAELSENAGFFVAPVPATRNGKGNAPGIVFTTWADAPPSRFLQMRDMPFETLNQRFGAQGGATEVAISTNPVGDAGRKEGVFIRKQRPPDGDLTQGGEERLLTDTVRDIRFEFYNGSEWSSTWDSQQAQKGLLPAMVRVSYVVVGDDVVRTFLVRLPLWTKKSGGPS